MKVFLLTVLIMTTVAIQVKAELNQLPSGFAKKVESGWLPPLCERGESMPDSIMKKWAKRRGGEKVRVLFVTGRKRGMFECLSIAKAFDFEFDVIPFWNNWKLTSKDKNLLDLLRYYLSSRNYDVIAVSGIWLSYLPVDCQREIAYLIKNKGVGLVYSMHGIFPRVRSLHGSPSIHLDPILPLKMNVAGYKKLTEKVVPVGSHVLARGQAFSEFRWLCNVDTSLQNDAVPLLRSEDGRRVLAATSNYGNGRVVAYNHAYGERSRFKPFFLPQILKDLNRMPGNLMDVVKADGMGKFSRWMNGFEYGDQFYGWLGKVIIWTAKKESKISLKSTKIESDSFKVRIAAADNFKGACRLRAVVRTALDSHSATLERSLQLTSALYESTLPLPSTGMLGKHFLDVYLLDNNGGVLDWTSSAFNLPGDLKVSYRPDYRVYNPTDTITALFHVSVAPQSQRMAVLIELFDLQGRLLIKKEKKIDIPEKQNELDVPLSLLLSNTGIKTRLANARFTFTASGRSVEIRDQFFVRQSPGWDEYHILAYDGVSDAYPMNDALCAALERSGHDTIKVGYPTPVCARLATETGLRNWGNWLISRGSTPEKMKRLISWFKDFSPVKYGLQDEPELQVYPVVENRFSSSKNQTFFQDWLKRKYSTLNNLNKKWGKKYKTWGDVVRPLWYEAIGSNNWSSWFDSRRNLDDLFISKYANASTALKSVLPYASTAINPRSIGTFSGVNLRDFSRKLGSSYLYNDFVRGNSPMGYLHLGWRWFDHVETFIGYTWATAPGVNRISHEAWDAARRGANVGWFSPCFEETPPQADFSYFNGDFTLNEKGQAIASINKVLISGMGDLAVNTKPLDEGIFIYYPRTLFYNNDLAFFKKSLLNNPRQNRKKMRSMSVWGANQMPNSFLPHLDALGYQYEFGDEKDLNAKRLKKTRVVLLQNAMCLGTEKLNLLRDFVKRGGCVIAEAGTARRNENGKIYANTPKAFIDIFGLKRTKTNRSPIISKDEMKIISKDTNDTDFTSGGYGQVFRRKNAFFINFPLPKSNSGIQLVNRLLTAAGVEPTYRIKDNWLETGTQSNLICSMVVRNKGDLTYLFLTGDGNKSDSDFSIKLPKRMYVYDVLLDKNLGLLDSIEGKIVFGEAALFALSPYETSSFEIMVDKKNVSAGESVEVKFKISCKDNAKPGDRLVMLECHSRTNGKLPYIPRKVILENGEGALRFFVPYNAYSGMLKLTARDLTSGLKANINVGITSPR